MEVPQSLRGSRVVSVHPTDSKSTNLSHLHLPGTVVASEPAIVVMPLDSSEHSEYAAHFYLKYIHRPVNKVYVCYVAVNADDHKPEDGEDPQKRCPCWPWRSDRVVLDVGPSPGVQAELERQDKMNYHIIKSKVNKIFEPRNVNHEFRYLAGKDAAASIIAFRKEIDGTLIVMGSRGEGAFKRHMFGSVSDNVLRNSLVPVVLVKKPQGAMKCTIVGTESTIIH